MKAPRVGSRFGSAWWALPLIVALVPSWALATDERSLVLRCDLECIIAIDGKAVTLLEPDQEGLFPLTIGKHMLTAVSLSADDIWENLIEVAGPESIKITVSLRQARTERIRLESETASLRTQVAEKQRLIKNLSTVQFPVRIPPRFVGGLAASSTGKRADLKISDLGVELFSEDGQVDSIQCKDIKALKKGGALSSLGAYGFLIQTRDRSLRLAVEMPFLHASVRNGPKVANAVVEQIRQACSQ